MRRGRRRDARVLLVVAHRELVERYVAACKQGGAEAGRHRSRGVCAAARARRPGAPPAAEDAGLVCVSIGYDRSTPRRLRRTGVRVHARAGVGWLGARRRRCAARCSTARAVARSSRSKRAAVAGSGDTRRPASTLALAAEAPPRHGSPSCRPSPASSSPRSGSTRSSPGSLGIGEILVTGGTRGLEGLAPELERLIGVRVRVARSARSRQGAAEAAEETEPHGLAGDRRRPRDRGLRRRACRQSPPPRSAEDSRAAAARGPARRRRPVRRGLAARARST